MKKLKDFLFPPRCCGCDNITETDLPVCEECKKLILHPSTSRNRCEICSFSPDKCICKKHQFFDRMCVSFIYEGTPQKTIFRLKFRSRPDIAKNYARLMYSSLNERDMLKNVDIITFIPMSPFAEFRRGYNQSRLLAQYLSELSSIPCIGILRKLGQTASQHSLSRISRTGNLLGVFEPYKDMISVIKGKTVLVVDDVITTGSTLNEIAKTLLIFGAEAVYAAACTGTKNSQKKH